MYYDFSDGTTDVTRTVHFGVPDPFQVEAYTRVLKGQLDFADVVFPASSRTSYNDIDILARRYVLHVIFLIPEDSNVTVKKFAIIINNTN